MLNPLQRLLLDWGLSQDFAAPAASLVGVVLVILVAFITHRLARGPVLRAIEALARRTSTN